MPVRRSIGEGGNYVQSTTKLFKTNPISGKPKMNLNHYITKDYENKSGLLTMEKQTQSNPKTRSEAEIPTGELLGIHKPGTKQSQFWRVRRAMKANLLYQFCDLLKLWVVGGSEKLK